MAAEGFFTQNGIGNFGFRWLHIVAGIAWIGLLYYFNLVQVPSFAGFGDEAKARNIATNVLARKALWWFRWAAVGTVLTGILITVITKDYFSSVAGTSFGKRPDGLAISTGMLLGIVMFLNVWGVIWRNQKIVLANAATVLEGGQANPDSPAAARRALMASRQNLVFSVSLVYFMVYKSHGPLQSFEALSGGKIAVWWIVTLVIVGVMEANALGLMPWKFAPNKGLNMLYDGPGVRNPLVSAFGLSIVFLILTEICYR